MKNQKRNPIAQAWHDFKEMFRANVHRDIAMMSIGQQVMSAIDKFNAQMYAATDGGPDGELPPMDMSGNNCHWLEDLYVAEDKSIFAITCCGGKLYRWSVIVASDNTVTLGPNQEVKPMFAANTQAQISETLKQNAEGRYEGIAIMGSTALNKDNEIDARRLFDCFIERFHGNREYINIYHLGGAKTKIGTITNIWREENLLIGHYILDDNPVANAAGKTLAADKKREWGGSIEFLSDDEGTPVEVAPNVIANMYTEGTLQGFSIAKAMHGAAWGTGHLLTRTPDMNKDTLAAIAQLMGDDPVALKELESWIDGENLRLVGAITRTEQTDSDQTVVAQAVEVEQAPADPTTPAAPAAEGEGQIVVDEKLLGAVTEALQNSAWWTTQQADLDKIRSRIDAIEQHIADSQASDNGSTEGTPPPAAQPTTQIGEEFASRLETVEAAVQQMAGFYERSKPAPVQVATFRPGTAGVVNAPAAPAAPNGQQNRQAGVKTGDPIPLTQNVQALWKPLNLPTRK